MELPYQINGLCLIPLYAAYVPVDDDVWHNQKKKKKGEQGAMTASWILEEMVNFLLAVLIALIFVFLLFLAIIALCVVVIVRDDYRNRKTEKNQEQKQIEGLPTQEKKKIKQFQNLMNYDGTKQRVIEDED